MKMARNRGPFHFRSMDKFYFIFPITISHTSFDISGGIHCFRFGYYCFYFRIVFYSEH